MKKLILFLFVVTVIGSCTNKEVDPDPAEVVAGTYNLTSLAVKSEGDEIVFSKLPISQSGITISGTAELTSPSTDMIDIRLSIMYNGVDDDDPADFEDFEIRKDGSDYNLYLSGQKVADLDGDTINFNFTTVSNGQTFYLRFTGSR